MSLESVTDCAVGDLLDYYARHDLSEWLWPHLEWCGRTGLVHMTTDRVLLARPVFCCQSMEYLNALKDIDTGNAPVDMGYPRLAWHVLYASGGLGDFFPLCPFPLPYLVWQRDGGAKRVYDFERVKSKIMR